MIDVDHERAMHIVELAGEFAKEVLDLELNRGVRRIDFKNACFRGSRRTDQGRNPNADEYPAASHYQILPAFSPAAKPE